MEVIGEAVLSAAVESLFEKLKSADFVKFATGGQVAKILKNWESKLRLIRAVLDDAEEKQVTNQAVKIWLAKLRDLAFDVEDILDEFQTEAMRNKLENAEVQGNTSTLRKLLPPCCTGLKPSAILLNVKTGSNLQEITARFEEIVKEKNDLDLGTHVGRRSSRTSKRVPTTSLVKETKVYGREKVKDDLVELLMSGEANNSRYAVIPIVGMGGIGKTTLAQLAYNDERLKFDYKAWVCVSDDFDIPRVTKTILQHWERCEDYDLNVLQVRLKEKLHGKKFLIVLDDVWSKNYEDWTMLCGPFAAGAPGSRIIVTTREEDVSSMIRTVSAFELKELSYDECLGLFSHHALDAENFDARPDLEEVGKQIVLRCKGLPLAAKTLGGLLRNKQKLEEWKGILNSDIWDLSEEESGILSALRLSYHHLPPHLKQCFAYCAIFPKDFEFDQNELVFLWMAAGFLQPRTKKQEMEELGHEYFRDLLSRSFFQRSSNNRSGFVMHDLIIDLAQFVSGQICFNLDHKKHVDTAESYSKVRLLSFTPHQDDISQRFDVCYEMKSLRTFFAATLPRSVMPCFLSSKVLYDLVPKLKCLRTLSLVGYRVGNLPDSIGSLNHLRCLNLSGTFIQRLPESLGELLNLQTLKLRGCSSLVELPACIGNLVNLQCLDIYDTQWLRKMPQGISKLINLRTLPKFIVGAENGLGELMKLSHLQGQLHITDLGKVKNIREAELASLKEKQGLRELIFGWSYFYGSRKERDELHVLNSLQPHQGLEKLSIKRYSWTEFPAWVMDSSYTKMASLQLHNCYNITSLQSLGNLPALRHLTIACMEGVREVMAENFPYLETLFVNDMPRLERWSWSNGLERESEEKFPQLQELTLRNCPNLIGPLPSCIPSLRKLVIYNCQQVTDLPKRIPLLRELEVERCQDMVFRSVTNFTSLTTLDITRISGLLSLHETLLHALVALKDLKIGYCFGLKYLWRDGTNLDKLANLNHLRIFNCNDLRSLVEGEEGLLPCNLQDLVVKNCRNLEKLPKGLHSLASLRELEIYACKELVSFAGGLPCNLKRLEIASCDSLESLPDGIMTMMNHNKNSNQCLLEELKLYYCRSLKSFPSGKLPSTLKFLQISRCEKLWSLPEGITYSDPRKEAHYLSLSAASYPVGEFPTSLTVLEIEDDKIQSLPILHSLAHLTKLKIYCPELLFPEQGLSLPSLLSLEIWCCDKLRSLPNHMEKLKSLKTLRVYKCLLLESLPEMGLPLNLTWLEIAGCKNLRQPISEWGLRKLTSLKWLFIDGAMPSIADVDYFPDDDGLLLPNSLKLLRIETFKNLKFISRGISNLTCLEELRVIECHNLQFLPQEGFPATLGCLYIWECPLLKEKCPKERGQYWPLIAHIPRVQIDGSVIIQ